VLLVLAAAAGGQVSQTSFNRFGSKKPGDSSGWTDTPQQAAQRAAGLLPAAGPAVYALTGPSISGAAAEGAPVSAELLAAMAKYNQSHRHKSLLEQHAEQGPQVRKKDKSSKEKEKEKEKERKEKEKERKEKEKERKEKSKDKSKDKSSRKEKEQDSKGQKRKASGGWVGWRAGALYDHHLNCAGAGWVDLGCVASPAACLRC
jgi:hypothetical protein